MLVKQVVITKASHATPASVQGMNNISAPPNRRLSKMGTSKLHKFKPSVSLDQALAWLAEYGEADSSVMFENDDCILFEAGKFYEFEGDDEEDDEQQNNGNRGGNQEEAEDSDVEPDSEDEKRPVEAFRVGQH